MGNTYSKDAKFSLLAFLQLFLIFSLFFIFSTHRGNHQLAATELQNERSRVLQLNQRFEEVLSGTTAYAFHVDLKPRQFMRVNVYPRGLDLKVSVIWPSGLKSLEWTIGRGFPSPVSFVSDLSGAYQLEVRLLDPAGGRGSFQISVPTLRNATALDNRQLVASGLLSEAQELRHQVKATSLRAAIRKYQQAAVIWRTVGDKRQEGWTLNCIGDLKATLSEDQKALVTYQEALKLWKDLGDREGETKTLNRIVSSYINIGENKRALLEVCTRALNESRAIGDPWEEAQASHNMGYLHYTFGEMQSAIELLDKSLELRRSLQDLEGQAGTLLILGYVRHSMKETELAKSLYQQSLQLYRKIDQQQGVAIALIAMGHLYNFMLGERQAALAYYEESAAIFRGLGDKHKENSALKGVGSVYLEMGEPQKALEYFLPALAMSRVLRDQAEEGDALAYACQAEAELGHYENSVKYGQKAASVYRAMGRSLSESEVLLTVAEAYEGKGDNQSAFEYYRQALETSRKGRDPFQEGKALNGIGYIYYQRNLVVQALKYYQEALAIQTRVGDSIRQPTTLYNLARAESKLGDLEPAIRYAEHALDVTESLRGKVASRDLRSSFVASVHQQYELTIDLFTQMHQQHPSEGYAARAFGISERARARSLLESLAETGTETRNAANPALLERRRQLQQSLNAKAQQQMRLPDNKSNGTKDAALILEIDNLTTQYEQVQAQIRSESPLYTSLSQLQPLSLKEVQGKILDEQSLLLEFALGDDQSYLWAVTQTGMTYHRLPKRTEIDRIARRLYELLTARQPKPDDNPRQYQSRVKEAKVQYWQHAAALSQVLLGPVADQLGKRRLLIVAEGALQYVPFGALPTPKEQGTRSKEQEGTNSEGQGSRDKGQGPELKVMVDIARSLATAAPLKGGISEQEQEGSFVPLIVDHEIVNLPSASALAMLRKETVNRQPANRSVAVLADPVFEVDDPRVSGRGVPSQSAKPTLVSQRKSNAAPLSDLQLSLRDVGMLQNDLSIPRLLSTRQEAEAILSVSPAGACLKAIDFKASRETALSPELSQFRIVHFATHGLLNNQHPELSGLVLSLVDEQGKPQNGFLRLHDIYNMNLPADLVVLSACNTGLGKDIKGEGLVGIVRGFMYAGAARVVASLWKVDDEATAELMKHFYQQMFQENQTPAAALRAAQIALWQQKQWQSPYYWAGFVLQGEWK